MGRARRFLANMNPTVRGLLLIALIALVIVGLELYQTLVALSILMRVAFFLAIAFFVYLVWRERRSDIGGWSTRAQTVFYGAAGLIVVAFGVFFWEGVSGPDALAFLVVLALCGFSMFRVWRDEHRYGM